MSIRGRGKHTHCRITDLRAIWILICFTKASIPFVQVAVLLSDRNTDFRNGGGFIIDRNNKKVLFENDKSMGAAIIFDGSLKHGVEEIDLDQVLDWSSTKGRIALFSNLYVNR